MAEQEPKKRRNQEPSKAERTEDVITYIPDVDIWESESALHLAADMPGIDGESVDIDLEGDVLNIHGSCRLEAPEGFNLHYQEYHSGNYERTFRLGREIDRDGIEASVNNGVLYIDLPKSKEAQPRKIEVKSE